MANRDALLGLLDPETAAALDAIGASGTSATEATSAGFDTSDQAIEDKARADILGGANSSSASSSRLANVKPSWYKDEAPPSVSMAGGLVQNGLGALQAGAQKQADLSAATPQRHYARKARDQQKASTLGVLSGLAGAFFQNPQANYENRLGAAGKQAAMNKVLHDSQNSGSANALAYLNYKRGLSNDALHREKYEGEEKKYTDEHDPDSELSKRAREAAYSTNVYTPGSLEGQSAAEIKAFRTSNMQTQNQDWRGGNTDRTFQNEIGKDVFKRNMEQEDQVVKESREDERKLQEYSIPGIRWTSGRPPPPKTFDQVTQLEESRQTLTSAAARLQKLNEDLEPVQQAFGANFLVQGFSPEEQKKILAEAKYIQSDASNAYRRAAEFGVLTGKEKEIADSIVVKLGTPQAFLNGQADLAALEKITDEATRRRVRALGGAYPEDEIAPAASPTATNKRAVPEFKPYQPVRGGAAAGDSLGGPVALPPKPDMGPADQSTGTYVISVDGAQSSPRQMTLEQLERARKKYGAAALKRVQ